MKYMYLLLYCIVFPFFNLVHPGRFLGRENIPEGGVLVCPNHTSLSDPLFMLYAFPLKYRLRAMAKEELMHVPVVGWLLNRAGVFGVSRGKADVGAIKLAMKVLKDGERLLIFPEGTRIKRSEGEEGEAKSGAAMLSIRCGVPILPVYIPEKKNWFHRTTVVIGEPYMPTVASKKGTQEEYEAITADLMARINALGERVV